jgi:hypothetical protein
VIALLAVTWFGLHNPAPSSSACDPRWEACNSQVWCASTRTYQGPYAYCPYAPGVTQEAPGGGD